MNYINRWSSEAKIVADVLRNAPSIDKDFRIPKEEFINRQKKVANALESAGISCGIVYSDEHFNGDVPYLGGNTNIQIEPVAGIIGKNGFFIMAGLEGGYVAEQLASRAQAKVCKVEMLKLADEEYPIDAVSPDEVIKMAVGRKPEKIGLLTPRAVLPVSVYEYLCSYVGKENIVDAQEIYYKIKYEKSDNEMRLLSDASLICDTMVEAMLSVIKPGMYETQVAQWGYTVALELGAEEMGFDIMVTANEANRTLIGKALNRPIREHDVVHVGVAPKRDGLTACERVSVVCVKDPSQVSAEQKYWFDFTEEAFKVGLDAYIKVAKENLPAKFQEQALVDYFKSRSDEVSKRLGKNINLMIQKPYTGTHNAGYTECQEFYGAITLNSDAPLGRQIVTMLDVAIRGVGNNWDDIIIPGLDYIVVEKTLAKVGSNVKVLNKLPINVQHLVGRYW